MRRREPLRVSVSVVECLRGPQPVVVRDPFARVRLADITGDPELDLGVYLRAIESAGGTSFAAHLDAASATVGTWPAWKRDILGRSRPLMGKDADDAQA